MSEIKQLTDALLEFRDARDWKQFHNSKDLALGISIESAELLELFLWKEPEAADQDKVKEELADIIGYCLLLANNYGFDIREILMQKIKANALKYPVEKAKGNAKKYDQF